MGKIELVIGLGLFLELIINGLYSMLETKSPEYVRLFIITRNIMPLITYFGFFAAGIIYYKVYTSGWTFGRIIILIISALSVILTDDISGRVSFFSISEHIICEVVINALFIIVVSRKGRLLKVKWLYFAGAISYPLYLVHESIGIATSRYFAASISRPLSSILGITISILVATIITYLFEKPVHKWLKNLYFKKIKPDLLVSKV
jgi:peptidoglycan/LPS O-acetylase OafA/YrhL